MSFIPLCRSLSPGQARYATAIAPGYSLSLRAVAIIASDVQLLDPKQAAAPSASSGGDEPLGNLDEPF